MRVLTRVLSVALAACLVGACGGGGGGGPTVSADPAPTGDTRTVTARFQSVHGRADTLLLTDFHWVGTGGPPPVGGFGTIHASCRGATCTGAMPSQLPDVPVYLSDLSAADEYEIFGTLNGVTLTRGTGEEKLETGSLSERDFGGWLDHNAFGVSHGYFYDATGAYVGALIGAYSIGDASGSRPVQGSATWRGAMLGAEQSRLDTVQGDARVTVDFATAEASVAFTNILNLVRGTSLPSMRWDSLAIDSGGRFSARSGRTASLVGTFYGPNHEEVGGVFERNDIAGAFGARRQ